MKNYNKYGIGLLLTSLACWSVVLFFLVGLDQAGSQDELPVKADIGVEQEVLNDGLTAKG